MLASSIFTFLTAALVVSSASLPRKRQTLATVYSSCKLAKNVALTFDDGPYKYIQAISDSLTNAGAKGTFFFNGNNFDCIYDADSVARVKYVYQAGHMIGDHTWAHADLATLTTEQIEDAMYRMEEAFSRIVGVKPAFIRPPYGSYTDDVRAVAFNRGQSLAMWDQDTKDADGGNLTYSEAVYTDAINQGLSTMLVLNHETVESTSTTLIPFAIDKLQKKGYKLVTVAECLGLEPYAAIGIPQTGTWSCDGTPGPGEGCTGNQCQTGTPPLSRAPSGPAPTGQPIHPGASGAKCLAATSNANSAPVKVQDCDGSASQSWTRVGSTLKLYGNKCLDVTGGSTANGNKMQIYTCSTGNPNQQFTIQGTKISWSGKNECLDLTGGSLTNGNVVQLWTCNGGGNQVWNIGTGGGSTSNAKTIRPNAGGNVCLTAASNANQAAVQIEPCSAGSSSQAWTNTGGTLQIFGNKCLDVTGGSTANGVKMQIYTCGNGNANQKFTVGSNKRITWTNKGECLDLTGGSLTSGNVVQMWKCSTGTNNNQVWNFV